MEEHTHLYLFRSSPPCLQTQILQSFSQFVFFGQPQNIIVKLQGIQHSQINSDCNCRCAFFYSGHSQQRTGWHVLQSEPHSDSFVASQFNLFSYNRHLLHQFSRQFGSHCILCHIFIYLRCKATVPITFTIVNLSYNMQRWRF